MMDLSLEEQRAWRAIEARQYQEAARLYEPLAASGSETALINLGWLYKMGHLGPPDPQMAMSLWERAAGAGSARARYRIGKALIQSRDLSRARALFLEAAHLGHKPSMAVAGKMLVRGQGGEIDQETGVAWLLRAANDGHLYARRELFRIELEHSRSIAHRFWIWSKVIRLAVGAIPKALRDRYSDDFRR